MQSGLVLVTGANGFVGKWIVVALLRAGFSVRGTVRSEGKAEAVRQAVGAQLGEGALGRLNFTRVDLMRDTRWSEAMSGVDAVVHVAAQVVGTEPQNSAKVIGPALEGTERVFRFAIAAGIRRIVLTSSIATIGYGLRQRSKSRSYTESDFTDLDAMKFPWAYCTGKTMAEQAAWAYARAEELRLTTIHPGAVLGPAPDRDVSASLQMVSGLLDGSASTLPRTGFSVVDVRDVATMHVAALLTPAAEGQRYIAASGYLAFSDVADMLRAAYPDRTVTYKSAPDWIVRLMARFGGPARQIINDIGVTRLFDGSKGEALLGRPYISPQEAVLSSAESVIGLGLLKGQGTP